MDLREVAKRCLRMPAEYKRLGNASMIDLMQVSEYRQYHEEITEGLLASVLRDSEELINDWCRLSDDKRTDRGWFIARPFDGPNRMPDWLGGDYPTGEERHFTEPALACAYFAKRELESCRTHPDIDVSPEQRRAKTEAFLSKWRRGLKRQ